MSIRTVDLIVNGKHNYLAIKIVLKHTKGHDSL
jgi:hypothetical protein